MILVCLINTRSGITELKKIWNLITFFRLGVVMGRERETGERERERNHGENDQLHGLYFFYVPERVQEYEITAYA